MSTRKKAGRGPTVKNNPLDAPTPLSFIGDSLADRTPETQAKPSSKRVVRQISARIDEALYDRFKDAVANRGMVQQDAVARAIEAWLDAQGR